MCPKCQGFLRTVERQGLRIEQCDRCRGIFLDHGELEQLLAAEQHYYAAPPHRAHADSPRPYRGHRPDSPRPWSGHHPDSPRPYSGHSGHYGHYSDSPRPYHGHRRSFLGDLFG